MDVGVDSKRKTCTKRKKLKCFVCKRTVRPLTHTKVRCDVCGIQCHYNCFLEHTCKSQKERQKFYIAQREKELEAARDAAITAMLRNSVR